MPRKRLTQSGAPAQPISPVAGQMYGAGEDQMAMQRAMPTPQNPVAAVTIPQAQASAAPSPAPQAPAPDLAAIAASLAGEGDLLRRPTNRPNEPVTAGLSRGLGPGPEILQVPRGNPGAQLLRKLSELSGDPYFAELADKAGM